MKNILYTIILSLFFSFSVFALEVTNYLSGRDGRHHAITVALKSLDDHAIVRCVIKMNDKPVGMKDAHIKGTGTIAISIESRPKNTSPSCWVREKLSDDY
jgi:hypothetical protein